MIHDWLAVCKVSAHVVKHSLHVIIVFEQFSVWIFWNIRKIISELYCDVYTLISFIRHIDSCNIWTSKPKGMQRTHLENVCTQSKYTFRILLECFVCDVFGLIRLKHPYYQYVCVDYSYKITFRMDLHHIRSFHFENVSKNNTTP